MNNMGVIKRVFNIDEFINKYHNELGNIILSGKDYCYDYYSNCEELNGIIVCRNNSNMCQLVCMYVPLFKRNNGIGFMLINKVIQHAEEKSLHLYYKYTSNDKKAVEHIGFILKNGFSNPQIIRRNGIINCQLFKKMYYEDKDFDETIALHKLNAQILFINLPQLETKYTPYLLAIQQIFNFYYFIKDKKKAICLALIIDSHLVSWVIFEEISADIINLEYLYCVEEYRQNALGFISFLHFFDFLMKKYSYKYISFTTEKEDDKLLNCYRHLLGESLFSIVDTNICYLNEF